MQPALATDGTAVGTGGAGVAAGAPPPEATDPALERGCGAPLKGDGVRVGRGGGDGGRLATATLDRRTTLTTSLWLCCVAAVGRTISATTACTSSESANARSSNHLARLIFARANNGSFPD
jgi:hypothetical protein